MQKIRLDVDDLRVDTFAVTPEPRDGEGTVFAHSETFRIPYSLCTSASDDETIAPTSGGSGPEEMRTCEPSVCDCDQYPLETLDCT